MATLPLPLGKGQVCLAELEWLRGYTAGVAEVTDSGSEGFRPDGHARRERILGLVKRLVVIALALVLVAWLIWTQFVPTYRPGLRSGESYGLDVSHHQGAIDWSQVASDNIEFAYLKATEGGDHVDRRFDANAKQAATAGLRIGAYHFFTFCRSGADQAANFLRVVKPDPEWLPPAVDVEYAGNCSKRPPEAELIRELTVFVDSVSAAWGRPVLAYVLPEVEDRYPALADLTNPAWQRHLFRRPGDDDWLVWQLSGFARVDGVRGPVDLNVGKLNSLAGTSNQ